MHRWLMIAGAGALGALARYALQGLVQRGPGYPWGTTSVNVAGCLLAGLLWGVFESRQWISPDLRAMTMIGFVGSFTTFSTLMLETHGLAREGQILSAFANLTLQIVLGMAALLLGIHVRH
jgi:fluoride exporter